MSRRLAISAILAMANLGSAAHGAAAEPARIIADPPQGSGQIVFWRAGSIVGMFENCAVSEGTTRISSLPRGKYFVVTAAPGKHTYTVHDLGKNDLTLEVEPDETQYVECRTSQGTGGLLGQSGLATLRPSSEADFQARRGLKLLNLQPRTDAATAAHP